MKSLIAGNVKNHCRRIYGADNNKNESGFTPSHKWDGIKFELLRVVFYSLPLALANG
jgi:hypothetical protein